MKPFFLNVSRKENTEEEKAGKAKSKDSADEVEG